MFAVARPDLCPGSCTPFSSWWSCLRWHRSPATFVVAFNMSDAPHFVRLVRRAPRADVAILLVTFVLTVFTDLVIAVNIGVILAMLQFLRRMSASVEVAPQEELLPGERLPPGILVYAIEGPLFFGAVESLERALAQTHTDPRWMIIRLNRVPFVDATGLQTLEEVVKKLEKRGVQVLLTEANERVRMKLARMEIIGGRTGTPNHFPRFDSAVKFASSKDSPPAKGIDPSQN
jgi:SulP family sulfate permease